MSWEGDGPVDVVVTLGTDHHPFARLVEWVDRWAADHPEAVCLVQHGTAPPPRHAAGRPTLDPLTIPRLMARSRVVVGHAGPGTVLDARAAGRLPVIVPRRAAHGEVVDDHQVAFGRWMAERGRALCVEDEDDLRHHLDTARTYPERFRVGTDAGDGLRAVTLLGDLIDGMLTR